MSKSVLVVEDNPTNRELVVEVLQLLDVRVLQAEDASTGIALARSERPDLILMDISLPGMDGLEATRRLKADPETRNIPVVALTAHAMRWDEQRAREAGCDGFITKPIEVVSFSEYVQAFLRLK
ncbi:MAG: two-component system response regulator [Candidatus Latescibacterota bacterium]|nr:MAG: two-component system response regulator [Candidatus Latescibacterota bacterium]